MCVDYFPAGCDYSVNFLVLVFVSGALSLCQIDVAFNDLYLIDGVSFLVTLVVNLFIYTLSSTNSCSICRSSCCALAYMSIPSEHAQMTETYLNVSSNL